MPDPNRPVAFEIVDTHRACVVAVYPTHREANDACAELEPNEPRDGTHWRYIIEPVRSSGHQ